MLVSLKEISASDSVSLWIIIFMQNFHLSKSNLFAANFQMQFLKVIHTLIL